jgi:hypothetical protein
VLLRLHDWFGLFGELSGKLDPCEVVLSGLLRISLGASHFRVSRCPDSRLIVLQKAYESCQMFEAKVRPLRRPHAAAVAFSQSCCAPQFEPWLIQMHLFITQVHIICRTIKTYLLLATTSILTIKGTLYSVIPA